MLSRDTNKFYTLYIIIKQYTNQARNWFFFPKLGHLTSDKTASSSWNLVIKRHVTMVQTLLACLPVFLICIILYQNMCCLRSARKSLAGPDPACNM
jgi:hypothetical protein